MIVTIHSVFCDRLGCNAWIGQERSRLAARHVAKDYGWTRVRERDRVRGVDRLIDLCPECSDPKESTSR